jgi:hypothetical protein
MPKYLVMGTHHLWYELKVSAPNIDAARQIADDTDIDAWTEDGGDFHVEDIVEDDPDDESEQ